MAAPPTPDTGAVPSVAAVDRSPALADTTDASANAASPETTSPDAISPDAISPILDGDILQIVV